MMRVLGDVRARTGGLLHRRVLPGSRRLAGSRADGPWPAHPRQGAAVDRHPGVVGIGPTKTLAKLANHLAKKNPAWAGVCDLTADSQPMDALIESIHVGEVWGIGRRLAAHLRRWALPRCGPACPGPGSGAAAEFSVVLERTVQELRGVSCLALEPTAAQKEHHLQPQLRPAGDGLRGSAPGHRHLHQSGRGRGSAEIRVKMPRRTQIILSVQ